MRAFAVQRIASRGFADYKECERTTLRYAQVVLRYKTQLVHQPRVSRRNITSNLTSAHPPPFKAPFRFLPHTRYHEVPSNSPSGGSTAWHCCGSIGSDVLPALLLRKQQCHGDEEAADNV
ncbi:hypothetical protein PSTG_07832 [Puccinia striiformis f. sp. tritici PST-78]|uniref:Uncharacterized protein n=1 Tax=Puccinia striiformis f. sp. tritici PST-78 TaxID=1165861 RepID=A0A0L0VIA9_9BASI|nr:hypothetical protein PSTG_07832 [Puccinia striiformis f. sp. tritici PST-78]